MFVGNFILYHYSIPPVVLTEFLCLSELFPNIEYEHQRTFLQMDWLGLSEVQDLFAGGLAFEYSIESDVARTLFVSY